MPVGPGKGSRDLENPRVPPEREPHGGLQGALDVPTGATRGTLLVPWALHWPTRWVLAGGHLELASGLRVGP